VTELMLRKVGDDSPRSRTSTEFSNELFQPPATITFDPTAATIGSSRGTVMFNGCAHNPVAVS